MIPSGRSPGSALSEEAVGTGSLSSKSPGSSSSSSSSSSCDRTAQGARVERHRLSDDWVRRWRRR